MTVSLALAARPVQARYGFGERAQFILRSLKLVKEVGAECFVGCGDEAGRIMRRDACKCCDLSAWKGDFYCCETQSAGDLCRACQEEKCA